MQLNIVDPLLSLERVETPVDNDTKLAILNPKREPAQFCGTWTINSYNEYTYERSLVW